nr:protein cft1 [Quercus suber]
MMEARWCELFLRIAAECSAKLGRVTLRMQDTASVTLRESEPRSQLTFELTTGKPMPNTSNLFHLFTDRPRPFSITGKTKYFPCDRDESAPKITMQCYTELIAPTAVTHSVSLPFLAPHANNLLVAKTSLLQVFSVKTASNGSYSKLVLVGEYTLSGTVTAIASISALNTKSGGEAVLIAFKDAKLSLVEWDPENHRISTVSIHYYEGGSIIHQPFGPSLSECPATLTVDPSSRCAALRFGARHLAILPFRQVGDDLAEGIDDGDVDMETDVLSLKRAPSQPQPEEEAAKQTPYKPSFVLPLTVLDPALIHVVHLAFLYEYREPTFGFLSSSLQPSTALLADRKDCLHYTILTLDLDQRASTNLVTVSKLPSDIWKIVPLALPVGGALLVGNNEFVHVDQSGKTNAVAVNEFARQASDFNMADRSNLNMKLENCEIAVLDPGTGDLLIVLDDGALATLTFQLLGRSVGGMIVTQVVAERGGAILGSGPSTVAIMRNNSLFIGSEDGDSVLLAWTKQGPSLSRKRSHAQMVGEDIANDENGELDEIDEDDLYATAIDPVRRSTTPSTQGFVDRASNFVFAQHDMLDSLGPINSLCLGTSSSTHDKEKLQLVTANGRGRTSRLTCLTRDIVPTIGKTTPFAGAKNAWAVHALSRDDGSSTSNGKEHDDNLLFVFDGESTKAYNVPRPGEGLNTFSERTGTEFEHDGETLAVAALADRKTVVQCRRTEIRTYNDELNLSSIIPMYAEDGDVELRIIATSLWNQYLLVLRDDSSIQILKFDSEGDAEPLIEEGMAIAEQKWLSGCLYSSLVSEEEPCIYLLGQEGGLHIFRLSDLKLCYHASSLTQLPPVLTAETSLRRGGGKAVLTELLVTSLGNDDHAQPYLVVRSSMDDLTLYEPFQYSIGSKTSDADFAALRFRKVPCQHLPKYDETLQNPEDDRPAALQSLRIGGYSVVYIPGVSPSMIVKDAKNLPKVISLRASKVQAITTLNYKNCARGFALIDSNGTLNEHVLPDNTWYGSGWSVTSVAVCEPSEEIRHVAFYEERQVYVLATCHKIDFVFPEDDGRHPDQDGTLPVLSAKHASYDCLSPVHFPLASRAYTLLPFFHGASSIVDATSDLISFLFSCPNNSVWV